MNNFLYQIYKGTDKGSSESPKEHLVVTENNFADALTSYSKIKEEVKEYSKKPENSKLRCYCCMIEIDLNNHLYGCKNGKVKDHGCLSHTTYVNNYTQSPRMHEYMVNKEAGKEISWLEIMVQKLYE